MIFFAQAERSGFLMSGTASEHWEWTDGSWQKGRQRLWREHSDAVNASLIARWCRKGRQGTVLKTDLFDEMCGTGLYPSLASNANRFLGIDISEAAARAARSRYGDLVAVAADVRRLPFDNDTFDLVISNSTLDHFEKHETIIESLTEIFRILRRDGQLILTMDNRLNPVIAIRNAVPYRFLKRIHLTPYYVGATWGPKGLKNQLVRTGFKIEEMDGVLHCPRVLAIAASVFLEKFKSRRLQDLYLRFLSCFESMRKLPTRFITGYYVAVRATKKSDPPF
jgi:SAM-dependent methyltransferase